MEISHEEFVTILKGKCKYKNMKENLRNINQKLEEKTENMRLNSFNSRSFFFKKKKRLQMNYITSDFNQLEDCQLKKNYFFVCNINMNTFALFTAEAWRKIALKLQNMLVNYVKINKSNISSRKLDLANIADKTQYYSSEFKKIRCKIQKCGSCQPCRIFIEITLAVKSNNEFCKKKSSYS